ncbi:MAG: acyltransferase [Parvibaculum sp.]|nr:acyltransferase [Parvibaculum sp.]
MKNLILIILVPLAKIFLRVFFKGGYLKGRFFEQSLGGYKWAIHAIWARNILRLGPPYPWPVHFSCHISNPKNVIFHPDDLNNFQSRGCYFQCGTAKIHIGRGCYIGPNVGLITQNHDLADLDRHLPGADIVLGPGCWIGMNSVLLPGVRLGSGTIVAAGSVVTKSFEQGRIVLAGVPARIVRNLDDRDVDEKD